MRAVEIIGKKRDGEQLSPAEIEAFVTGATSHLWPDYQVSALLMAVLLRGMTAVETSLLTSAMVRSGQRLDLSDIPGPKVDKHSTGGVGDKTSLILAPLAAACGIVVPMMSGRGLGHTGGTLDKLEAIPGFQVALTLPEFRAALKKVGVAMIGQTAEVAPADKVLYALRDVTATVESVPLISASIMSKKLAEGIDALVLDVKCGRGAFMKKLEDARQLAESLVSIGKANGVRCEAMITAMDAPLGRAVGNSLEVIESIETLRGRGPADLQTLSVKLTARMLLLGHVARNEEDAAARVHEAIATGRGLDKFRQMVEQQGGDPRVVDDYSRLPAAPHRQLFRAARAGYVTRLDAELVGRATMILGAGRARVDDTIDPGVGAIVRAKVGESVRAGDSIIELHYRDGTHLDQALEFLRRACAIDDAPPSSVPLVLEIGSRVPS